MAMYFVFVQILKYLLKYGKFELLTKIEHCDHLLLMTYEIYNSNIQ